MRKHKACKKTPTKKESSVHDKEGLSDSFNHTIENLFTNKYLNEPDIFSESEILNDLISNNVININDVIFFDNPVFLKIKNVKLLKMHNYEYSLLLPKFKKIHENKNNMYEQVHISFPKILEIYYKIKNIKFTFVNKEDISTPELESLKDVNLVERFNLLKIQLNNT